MLALLFKQAVIRFSESADGAGTICLTVIGGIPPIRR